MYVVDASVWVARFSEADSFHSPSRQWITIMMTGGVALAEPVLLLPEVAGALSRSLSDRARAKRAAAIITSVPTVSLFDVDAPLAREAASIATELNLRGYDAVYVALTERLGLQLVSWDRDHLSRASKRVPVLRPDDLLAELGAVQ